MRAVYIGNMSSIFSAKSEADASELSENIEDMFPRYSTHIMMCLIDRSVRTNNK